jgi:hypothetical protein
MINVQIHLQLGREIEITVTSSPTGTTNWVSIIDKRNIINQVDIFFPTKEQAEDVARALRGEPRTKKIGEGLTELEDIEILKGNS